MSINLWKVQRLEAPSGGSFINPFGNTITEIESKDAQEAVDKVFNPEYMGAAEYEWGALPKRLAKLWEADIRLHAIEMPDNIAVETLYIVCRPEEIVKVQEALIDLVKRSATKDGWYPEVCKADHGSFRRVLLEEEESIPNTVGWLAMDHNLAWFTDKDMALGFMKLVDSDERNHEVTYDMSGGSKDSAWSDHTQSA